MSDSGFYSWLLSQGKRDDVIGDFATDVKASKDAPTNDVGKEVWLSYLSRKGASSEAIEAFEDAWAEFSSQT